MLLPVIENVVHLDSLPWAGERKLKYVQEEYAFAEFGNILSVQRGDLRKHFHFQTQPYRKVSQAKQNTSGTCDGALSCRSVAIEPDLVPDFSFTFLQCRLLQRKGRNKFTSC